MKSKDLSHVLRKEAIKKGHSVQSLAEGHSMFPFLRKGDLLTVEPVSMEKINHGDVVVFEGDDKWIAHRVIKIRNRESGLEFLLRGDTCVEFDPLVNEYNYIGKVHIFQRKNSIRNVEERRLVLWKKIIITFGLIYNFPLYFARIFAKLILDFSPLKSIAQK